MSKPEINARLEHVTRKPDRRKPEYPVPSPIKILINMSDDHVRTLAQALEHQLYRLEAEEKAVLAFPIRQPYLLDAIRAETTRSHDLLNATRDHLKNRGAGAMTAGGGDAAEG